MNWRNPCIPLGIAALIFAGAPFSVSGAEVNVKGKVSAAPGERHVGLKLGNDGIEVNIDGKLFTVYRFDEQGTPVFYPVIGPNGENITRHYPMVEGVADELKDHPHHRSIWFGHHDVNGYNLWALGTSKDGGVTKHRKVRHMRSGAGDEAAVLIVENDWIGGGEMICSDEREYRFCALGNGEVLLDYIVTVKADQEKAVRFGNQKDGIMAMRVAPWMRLEDREGNRWTGSIVNSEGAEGKEAWGKRADWIDYFGTAPDGKVYGIAIFDHPENLRHPTWWHARHYGLCSANPFGQGSFEKGTAAPDAGSYTIKEGDELRLHYRFYIHRGDTREAKVGEYYERFAKEASRAKD